jgi:protein O-mannosyl-transferase
MRRDWQIMALLAAATLAVFWQVSRHEFVNYDDPAYVTFNPTVQQGLTWQGVAWAFGELHGEATYWHPLTWLSHMLDCQLFGLRPAGHHLSSLCLHTLNTILLFVLLRGLTGCRGPSAMVAALFALHPLQVDSVAWVAERKNLLSTCFGLFCLWAYARYVEIRGLKSKVQSLKSKVRREEPEAASAHATRNTQHAPFFYLLSLLLFALGLMSKPSLVPLPFVLLLLDYWPLRRVQLKTQDSRLKTLLPLFLEKLPFLALSAASSLVTIRAHQSLGALLSMEQLPLSLRLANAAVACALYLRKLAWPLDLSVFYLHPGRWPVWAVAGSVLLLLGVTAAAVWQARHRPYLIVGWLWFIGMLVPVLGLVQAHVQALADRFAYLASVGVFIMAAWTVADWTTRRQQRSRLKDHRWTEIDADPNHPAARSATASTPPAHGEQERDEIKPGLGLPHLGSSVSICGSFLCSYGLAVLLLAGCVVMTSLQLRHWRDSITLLRHAVVVEPNNFIARVMLGNALFERRQLDGALREYRAALTLRPDYAEAWLRAGVVLTEQGRPAEAMPHLVTATQLAPGWPEPQRRLALALLRQGQTEAARVAYQKLVPLMPATAEGWRDLADMLAEGQQYAEAVHYYCEALRLRPDFAAALNNLAVLRASCKQPEFRDGLEAVRLAEAACRLSGRRNPSFLGTLADAYAEAGRFSEAVRTIQEAQALARALGADDLLPTQAQMLKQFRVGKPSR